MTSLNGKLSLLEYSDLVDRIPEGRLRHMMRGCHVTDVVDDRPLLNLYEELGGLAMFSSDEFRLAKYLRATRLHPLAVPSKEKIVDGMEAIYYVTRGGKHRYQCIGHLLTNVFELPHMYAAAFCASPGFNLLSPVNVKNLTKGLQNGGL